MTEIFNVHYPLLVPWKGQTFQQITSTLKKNAKVDPALKLQIKTLMLPNPLKIYRREIANTVDMSYCNPRTSLSIDEINRPNGSIVHSASNHHKINGLVSTLDINLTSNKYERPGSCSSCATGNNALSLAQNALRRVRSSGMIKKQFDLTNNNTPTYYTNTAQYLKARNINFEQNQYNFIRMGDSSVKPGSSLSVGNLYTANGLTKCKKYTFVTDTSFSYKWIDSETLYTVTIKAGAYDVNDINNVLKQTMINNEHYVYTSRTIVFVYLLNIAYNNYSNTVELQVSPTSTAIFPNGSYTIPSSWTNPGTAKTPRFVLSDNVFTRVIGFTAGSYPTTIQSTNKVFSSTSTPQVGTRYAPLHYKPSNPQFGQQGAVTASSLITRVKYDTITTNAGLYSKSIGPSVGSALAYSSKTTGYTVKDKMGFPNICTPVIDKYTGKLKKCDLARNRGGI